eukprot:3445337-Pyramimonas_sp.AAC.1
MKSAVSMRGHFVRLVSSAVELRGSARAASKICCTYWGRKAWRYPLKDTPRATHQSSIVMSKLPCRCFLAGLQACRPDSRVVSQDSP